MVSQKVTITPSEILFKNKRFELGLYALIMPDPQNNTAIKHLPKKVTIHIIDIPIPDNFKIILKKLRQKIESQNTTITAIYWNQKKYFQVTPTFSVTQQFGLGVCAILLLLQPILWMMIKTNQNHSKTNTFQPLPTHFQITQELLAKLEQTQKLPLKNPSIKIDSTTIQITGILNQSDQPLFQQQLLTWTAPKHLQEAPLSETQSLISLTSQSSSGNPQPTITTTIEKTQESS